MKRIFLLLAILPLLITSCEVQPHADFYASEYDAEPYQIINFYNQSDDFTDFEWDFGDGTFSTRFNPSHFYEDPGVYYVKLTVFGRNGEADAVVQTIEVYQPTTLEITVLEYYDEYPVANASVILYPSLYDWENETNAIRDEYGNILEGITDEYGVVTFAGVDPVSYWIDVWSEHHNNYVLAREDENFIRTLPLLSGKINTFIAYVDYVSTKSTKGVKSLNNMNLTTEKRTFPTEAQQTKEFQK